MEIAELVQATGMGFIRLDNKQKMRARVRQMEQFIEGACSAILVDLGIVDSR